MTTKPKALLSASPLAPSPVSTCKLNFSSLLSGPTLGKSQLEFISAVGSFVEAVKEELTRVEQEHSSYPGQRLLDIPRFVVSPLHFVLTISSLSTEQHSGLLLNMTASPAKPKQLYPFGTKNGPPSTAT